MKKFLSVVSASAAALALWIGGCAGSSGAARIGGELSDTVWKPEGSPRMTYVEFTSDNRVVGCAGVNRFFGPVSYEKGKRIRIGPLASTRMSGPDAKYEARFFSGIEETRGYVLEEDKLTLYNEERQPVMVLIPLKKQVRR